MKIEQNDTPENDLLEQATAALREMSIADGPSKEILLQAEQIPTLSRHSRRWIFLMKLSAACVAISLIGLFMYSVMHSGTLAFAEVAQTLSDTRSFTATINEAQLPTDVQITVKGSKIRMDIKIQSAVIDEDTGEILQLSVPTHEAQKMQLPAEQLASFRKYDLYALVHNYQTADVKSIGEKTIGGQKVTGFQLKRPETESIGAWTFWVDPQTRLPVQIEVGPIVATHLQFDVPVDDSLFDMKVPAGYTLQKELAKPQQTKFAGQVLDETGQPAADVQVTANRQYPGGKYGVSGDTTKTDREGRFTLATAGGTWKIRLELTSEDLLYTRLEDVNLLSPAQQIDLQVKMSHGKTVAGKVVDAENHPIAGARVEAVFGKPVEADRDLRYDNRRSIETDAHGNFELHGLLPAAVVLQVQKLNNDSQLICGQARLDLATQDSVKNEVQIIARPFKVPADAKIHTLLGMKLIEVNDELRDQLSPYSFETLLMVDPGQAAANNGLRSGDAFWDTDARQRIKDFPDLVRQLLAACETQKKSGRLTYSVGIHYDYVRAHEEGSTVMFLHMSDDDIAELQRELKR